MTITLLPEHERLIRQALDSGAYQSPNEVVGRALEMLHSEDKWFHNHKEEIAEKIDRAFEQFDRGEYFSAEASRTDMDKRKVAWLGKQTG